MTLNYDLIRGDPVDNYIFIKGYFSLDSRLRGNDKCYTVTLGCNKILGSLKTVGAAGLELATSASQTLRSSHLSYAP